MTPTGPLDRAQAERYAAAGVHRLVLHRWQLDAAAFEAMINEVGETLIGQIEAPAATALSNA